MDKYTNQGLNFNHIVPWRDAIYTIGMDENTDTPVARVTPGDYYTHQ